MTKKKLKNVIQEIKRQSSQRKKKYVDDTLWEIFDYLESIFHTYFKHYLRKMYSLEINCMF